MMRNRIRDKRIRRTRLSFKFRDIEVLLYLQTCKKFFGSDLRLQRIEVFDGGIRIISRHRNSNGYMRATLNSVPDDCYVDNTHLIQVGKIEDGNEWLQKHIHDCYAITVISSKE